MHSGVNSSVPDPKPDMMDVLTQAGVKKIFPLGLISLLCEWAFNFIPTHGSLAAGSKAEKGSSAEEGPLKRGKGPIASGESCRFCRDRSFENAGISVSTLLGLSSPEEHLVSAKQVWPVLFLLPQC